MKNIVKYMMAAAVMTATFPVLAQNLPDGVYEEKNGIAYKKTATLKEGTTDTYTIDLEAFVTGAVTVKNTSVPADIVLVLDVSGSMDDEMYEYSYSARTVQNYSYNTNNVTNYYYKLDDKYYQINQETESTGEWWNPTTYYRLYFTANGTKYYLTQNGGTNTTTTTPPTNVTRNNNTIWRGTLYNRQQGASLGTKIDNLKKAVKTFIGEIRRNDLYDDDGNRRKDKDGNETTLGNQISIVKFAADRYCNASGSSMGRPYDYDGQYANVITPGNHRGAKEDSRYNYTEVLQDFISTGTEENISTINAAINSIVAGGATAADFGMMKAQYLLASLGDDRAESAKTVIMFTDGEPNHSSGFSSEVASNTIGIANTLKNTYEATVFTVGVFDSISEDLEDYMNFVSSNYPNARNMSQPGNPVSTDASKLVYYQNASGADLSSVFQTIAESSGGSGNTEVSGGSVVTVDVVASSFSLPENVTANDITVRVAPCIGTQNITWTNEDGEEITKDYLTFGEAKVSTEYGLLAVTPTVDAATRTVSTTGFDFSANWCGPDEDNTDPESIQPGYHGFKQIISFDIKVNPDAVGGPNVATNDKKSGIYVDGKQIAEFNRPTVKLPISIWIKKQGLLGDDSAVFNIRYAPYQKGVDPTTIPKAQWKSFTKVMISKDSPKDPKDGLPMEKLVGLDPNFFYRIDEDAWAWSYNYQDNGTQYTVGEDLVNPFKFVNKPKETVREAEASIRNVFEKKSSTTTTPTE